MQEEGKNYFNHQVLVLRLKTVYFCCRGEVRWSSTKQNYTIKKKKLTIVIEKYTKRLNYLF